MKRKHFGQLIALNLFTSANCTITQIALTTAYSYIFSNSIFCFSFFTGLYLMSMGLGALLVERFHWRKDQFVELIFLNSLAGVVLANPGVLGILGLNEGLRWLLRTHDVNLLGVMFPLGIVLSVLIGLVSGAELPIFSKLTEADQSNASKPMVGVLVSDYLGAALGILLFTFILNPLTGLIPSLLISQAVTLIYIACAFLFYPGAARPKRLQTLLLSLCLYVALLLLVRGPLALWIDGISAY